MTLPKAVIYCHKCPNTRLTEYVSAHHSHICLSCFYRYTTVKVQELARIQGGTERADEIRIKTTTMTCDRCKLQTEDRRKLRGHDMRCTGIIIYHIPTK